MFTPLICHFLIGCPGSGKSTLAALLAKEGNYRIVSTDQIREALYGNASIQGDWSVIEAQVLSQIQSAIASNQPVIYDATNAKRDWRMELLMQLHSLTLPTPDQGRALETPSSYFPLNKGDTDGEAVHWMAWHLTTPLETCKAWNQKRDRQVPDGVIESMFKSLQDFPPVLAEGFAAVNMVNYTTEGFDIPEIWEKIKCLSHTLTNRSNPTKPHKISPLLL